MDGVFTSAAPADLPRSSAHGRQADLRPAGAG